MRLIDADALKEWVEEYHTSNWGIPQDELIYAIGSAPTIDPVKHGRWKNKQMHDEELNEIQVFRHRCSECRFEICTTDETLWWQYCPNCGSKNGGEG